MELLKNWKIIWIDTEADLKSGIEKCKLEQIISIDTETIGWQTGNDKLALIQIGLPSTKEVLLIDSLKITDISALEEILSKPIPNLIAHNAAFEERQFKAHGIRMEGTVDTMKLSRQLRPDLPSHSLKTCCRYLLNIEISKDEQTSDWGVRPLSQSQLDYAALDAVVTYDLYMVFMELQSRITVDPDEDVAILMKRLAETMKKRWELTKDISSDLAFCTVQEEMLKESIKTRLKTGDSPYKGEYGTCSLKKVKETEINPNKVRELFPNLAEQAIKEMVDRKRLKQLLPEYGFEESDMDKVIETVGFNERLELKVDYTSLSGDKSLDE